MNLPALILASIAGFITGIVFVVAFIALIPFVIIRSLIRGLAGVLSVNVPLRTINGM